MSSKTGNVLAVILLLVGVVFRLLYLTSNPPGFHPDEINDIRIVETIRQGRIEVFYDLGNEGREGLYQTLITVATSAVGGGLLGYRLVAVFTGLLTLAAVYALVKQLFTPLAAVSSVALLTVSMLPVLLSRTVTRETVLPLLLALILLSLARGFSIPKGYTRRTPSTTPFTALGLLLGIGFYFHPSHYIIALGTLLFIFFMILRRPMTRRSLGYLGFSIVIMIVVAVPYMISAIRLPELSGAQRVFTGLVNQQSAILSALLKGLGGIFLIGDQNPIYNLPGRPMIDLVSGLFMLVGLLVAVRYARRVRFTLPLIITLVLLPLALLTSTSPNFEAMALLLPLVALFFGVGVSSLYHSLKRPLRPLLALLLLGLFVANIYWTSFDLFRNWPRSEEVRTLYDGRIAEIATYLDRTAGTLPTVLCIENLTPQTTPELESYELLALMMHRQNVALRYAECGSGMVFTNGGERQQIVFLEQGRMREMFDYIQGWLNDGVLLLAPDAPPETVIVLDAEQRLADTVGRFTTTVPVMFAPETPGGMELTQPPVRFGGNVSFLGYEPLNDEPYRPGDYVTVMSYWRVDGIVPSDLRLFTHILLDPTLPAAQQDVISVLPRSLLPRDVLLQISFVQLPEMIQSGQYRVSIGAYENNTGTRLPVFQGEAPRGARLFLDEITVEHTQSES